MTNLFEQIPDEVLGHILKQTDVLSFHAFCETCTGANTFMLTQEQAYLTVEKTDRATMYTLFGIPYRITGPAIVYNDGSIEWERNGVPHNDNGPAYKYMFGMKCKVWYVRGEKIRCEVRPRK